MCCNPVQIESLVEIYHVNAVGSFIWSQGTRWKRPEGFLLKNQVFIRILVTSKTAILEIFLDIFVVTLDSVLNALDLRTKILFRLKFDEEHDAINRKDLRPKFDPLTEVVKI